MTDLDLPAALEEDYQLAFQDLAQRRGLSAADLLRALAREAGCPKLDAAQLRLILLQEVRSGLPDQDPVLRENGNEEGAEPYQAALAYGLEAVKKISKK